MQVLDRDLQPGVIVESSESARPNTLSLQDFWSLNSVSDVQASPDGTTVAYVVGTYDEKKNASHSAVWVARLEDGRARQFTTGDTADMQPRWSPDGTRLAFVSARHEGKPQIFIIDRDGGEPRRITSVEGGAHSPVWSPDGTQLCFSTDIKSDRQKSPQELAWLEAHPDVEKGVGELRIQKSLMSRFDARGYIDKRLHLFLISVDEKNGAATPTEGAEARQLTDGDFDDAEAAWSPDGRSIAFVSHRGDETEHSMNSDIWLVDVGSGELTRLTDGSLMAGGASWSPDGKTLAFYANPSWTIDGYRDAHLWTVSATGGGQRDVSGVVDLGHRHVQPDYMFPNPTPPAWSADSRTIYFLLIDHGDDAVFAANLDTNTVRRLSSPGTDIMSIQVNGDHLVLLAVRPDHPFDIFVMPASGGAPQPVTSTNGTLVADRKMISPQLITATGPKGWDIEGWLYAPDGVENPPLVLHVHGGPYGAWGTSFYFQAQVLAGMGYASLYVNPRGSIGYGEEFSKATGWGEDDFRDLLAVVDAVVDRGLVDPERIGITGISYGGFMTNWALGNSDRFRAGVSVNGVSNHMSMFGVSDVSPVWLPFEFGGAYWESKEAWEKYWHHSPITYVEKIDAPLLLIQSENDYRCPIDQGEQLLSALRVRRRTVELVRFPGCSHVIAGSGTPLQRYLQWKLAFDWFDAHLKGDAGSTTDEDEGGVTVTDLPVER